MDATRAPDARRAQRTRLVLMLTAAAVVFSAGCASHYGGMQPTTSTSSGKALSSEALSSKVASSKVATASGDPTAQSCAGCSTKSKAPVVVGTPTDENGVQVLNIGVLGGFYSPNHFTVKADVPVTARFSGKAKGCLGHPVFSSLGKKADLTRGDATVNLGVLKPGTYKFSCSMGMGAGTIDVQ